jgi:hypothetical protein
MRRNEDIEVWILIYQRSCTKMARSENTMLEYTVQQDAAHPIAGCLKYYTQKESKYYWKLGYWSKHIICIEFDNKN